MIANYGYQDGSGTYFITVDMEKCDGCGKCAEVCPCEVLEIVANEFDPMDDGTIASVVESHRNKLKYSCAPCKPVNSKKELPCIQACPSGALKHSW
jgi:ferredoxin